ncbi:nitrogen assimilation regulatory protein NtrC [Neokomagataea thailandica NBRC 106555]|uniref:Nitrogen assimilation regulator n=2 Tax=Neokomagataea TaxID=1223423 RepID=A0A4Y6V5B0_9PROT|nr:nitrogen assimilation regulator [Neokomagataea tanensis]GBR54682.1 nitrogen assimilation regulatory protein NtrC [Neokomagataea thailandica NBRC 106555]
MQQALRASVLTTEDPTMRPLFLYGATRLDRQDVARRLHIAGPRARSPFIVATLTATPRALRPVALFGDGANTPGWISEACGGTLLLDEIDCLWPDVQHHLIQRLHIEKASFRLLVGSRYDPTSLLRHGGLDDTFHAWLSRLGAVQRLGPERISAICRQGGTGEAQLRGVSRALERPLSDFFESGADHSDGDLHACVIAEVERPLIDKVLRRTGGNQIRAAAILGLNRNTLRKKIRDLDISVPKGNDD